MEMMNRLAGQSKTMRTAVVDFMLTSGFLFYDYGFELSVSGEAYDTIMERGSHECK
jgi:hypothetical protein